MTGFLVGIAGNATVFGAGKCRDIDTLSRIGPIVPAATKDLNPITTTGFGTSLLKTWKRNRFLKGIAGNATRFIIGVTGEWSMRYLLREQSFLAKYFKVFQRKGLETCLFSAVRHLLISLEPVSRMWIRVPRRGAARSPAAAG
jgi:hypothetical protein